MTSIQTAASSIRFAVIEVRPAQSGHDRQFPAQRLNRRYLHRPAGACNHPNCLVLPFRLELIRTRHVGSVRVQKVVGWRLLSMADHMQRGQAGQYDNQYAMMGK
jgi:hypothetical protein